MKSELFRVKNKLLLTDAAINVLLGTLLLVYPPGLVEALGLPVVDPAFFPSVLGGVLIGIGLALILAARGSLGGLGIDGAIAINLCGAGVVAGWLLVAPQVFPLRGRITLWVISLAVIGIGCVELFHRRER